MNHHSPLLCMILPWISHLNQWYSHWNAHVGYREFPATFDIRLAMAVLEAKVPAARPSFPSSLRSYRLARSCFLLCQQFQHIYMNQSGITIPGGKICRPYWHETTIPAIPDLSQHQKLHDPHGNPWVHLLRSSPRVILVRSTPTRRDWTWQLAVP